MSDNSHKAIPPKDRRQEDVGTQSDGQMYYRRHDQSQEEVVSENKNNSNQDLISEAEVRRLSENNNSKNNLSSTFSVTQLNKTITLSEEIVGDVQSITPSEVNKTIVINDNSDLNITENNNSYKDLPTQEINCSGSLIREEKILSKDCVEIDNNKANQDKNSINISLEENGNDIKSPTLSVKQLISTEVVVNEKTLETDTKESEKIIKSDSTTSNNSNGISNLDNSFTHLLSSFENLHIKNTPIKQGTPKVTEQNLKVQSQTPGNSPSTLLEISALASPNELDKTTSCLEESGELDSDEYPKETENGDLTPKSSRTLNGSDRENIDCTLSPINSSVKQSYSGESCVKSLSAALSTTTVVENSIEFLSDSESSVKNSSIVINTTGILSPAESPKKLSIVTIPGIITNSANDLTESLETNSTAVSSSEIKNSEGDCSLSSDQSTDKNSFATVTPTVSTENSSLIENFSDELPSEQIESITTSPVILNNSTNTPVTSAVENVSLSTTGVISDSVSDNILLPTASAAPSIAIESSAGAEQKNFGPDSNFNFKMTDLMEKINQQQAEISDLKLKLNAAQQHNATLELQIRQNEEIVIKTQAEALKTEQNYQQEVKQLKQNLNENSKIMDKDRIQELEEQIKEAKAREAKLLAEIAQRNKDDLNKEKIMDQYEATFKMRLADNKKLHDEHETVKTHLTNLELAFSDVHAKYEKGKALLQGLKVNEKQLLHDLELAQSTNIQHEERYESLKAHAKTQIEKSNKEIHDAKEQHEMEINKLRAFIRRLEIKVSSLEVSLQQKTEECEQLSALCDEVTGEKV